MVTMYRVSYRSLMLAGTMVVGLADFAPSALAGQVQTPNPDDFAVFESCVASSTRVVPLSYGRGATNRATMRQCDKSHDSEILSFGDSDGRSG